ncbi:MAG: two-component system response regulator [Ectothiorhodospiraceae bacterium]|nr:two-component system response regulator [Chromatiales bacterium]MCP5156954.1 two-component system response regulator [Ectothiorhodospiraceae bacterium]
MGQPATVLIVDDVPENLTVLGETLRPSYRVLAANTSRRALQLAVADPAPDIILLDLMMPEMDGYEVKRALAADPRTRDIPVIFVTAMDSADDERLGLYLGAVDYITKPVHPGVVLARVRTQLELKRARDRLRDQNTWLEAEIARRMGEYELLQSVSIHALARLAEVRDPETGNHILRTREYVRTLAAHLSGHPRFEAFLDPATIDAVVKSAPLHDIGKVGIPDHILLKPGRLSPDEWTVMKTHAALGADAIAQAERDAEGPAECLTFAKQIARHHHEHWDGSGYPDGLAGDDIPIPARLMAIADVFDALISRRVYKAPMPFVEARAIMVRGRATQFDPDVLDGFLECFDQFCRIAERYRDEELGDVVPGGAPLDR